MWRDLWEDTWLLRWFLGMVLGLHLLALVVRANFYYLPEEEVKALIAAQFPDSSDQELLITRERWASYIVVDRSTGQTYSVSCFTKVFHEWSPLGFIARKPGCEVRGPLSRLVTPE